ncbi:response regulator transcription factor [Sphaerotilus natans]|uniref:response regulator transcription factor n=1 Tax=Sphaerotilus natans TaxID=34103 RepID=UPI00406CEB4A
MRLLLLEDDPILGEGLRDFLRVEGHGVEWFQRLGDAMLMAGEPYDALLVDWQLPDGSGIDWVRTLRRRGLSTPILMLTARDRLGDRINGLDAGADDYLVKPFEPEEMAARLRAVCRRSAGSASDLRRIGAVEIELSGRTARLEGRRVELTAREWAVLEALVLRAGRIVSKTDLDALVLGNDAEVVSNALEVHISALRRKLGRELIETVRGMGYRLATT